MTISFQDILKQKSAALSQSMTTSKKPDGPLECTVTIDDNVKPAELHVWFNRYPGPDIIADLKAAGFRWNSRVWWAIDSEPKRAFCRARLNAKELDPFETPATPLVQDTPEYGKQYALTGNRGNNIASGASWAASEVKPAPEPSPSPEIIVAPEPEPDNTPFGIYKRQVDELCEQLKLSPVDVFLHAIDRLHKTTFSVN